MQILKSTVVLTINHYFQITLEVDNFPKFPGFVKKDGLYRADAPEGVVSYFSYTGPTHGYGGSKRSIQMADGSVEEHIGGWSSRAGQVNRHFDKHIVDVVIVEKGTHYASSITLELAEQLLKGTEYFFVKIDEGVDADGDAGDITYEIHSRHVDKNAWWYACGRCGWKSNTTLGNRGCPNCRGEEMESFPPAPQEKCYVL